MRRLAVLGLAVTLVMMAACGGGSDAPPAISVAVSPGTAQTIDQGQTKDFTATVSNDSANAGVNWSVAGASCSGAACGTLSGTTTAATYTAPATVSSALTVTVTATSVTDSSKSAAVQVTVMPAPSVTTTSLPNGTVGTAYSTTLAATGGVSPLTWSVTAGTLPAGLSLNASSGAITGTPTTAGTSNITVQVRDSATPALTATKDLSITIAPAPLVISTTSLPGGTVNSTYSATLASTGGTGAVTWSVTVGSLPAGLNLNAATGAITGTPTAAGTVNFTATATDSGTPTPQTANKALSIVVNPVLSVTTASLADGQVNTAYSATLQSAGGTAPVTWSVTVGTLPAGLTLNASTGAITGTPTTASATPVAFTVRAADSSTPQQTATAALSIKVNAQPLVISTTSLPSGAVTSNYSATLASTGGLAPITWAVTVGTLPAGLSLDANTGEISGVPTTAGTSNFTITASDASTPALTATKALSITINASLTVTTTSLPDGAMGTAYNQTLASNGGIAPITWSVTAGALPGGLSLNTSTGAITGTPTTAGTFNFTVQAADSGTPQQLATAALSINVAAAPLVITTTTLPNATVGAAYSANLDTTGGAAPFTWSVTVGSLPAGLSINTTTGAITGTPTATGTSNFTVQVVDSSVPAQTITKALAITVNPGGTNNAELNGQYAFMFSGFGTGGFSATAGKMTADGAGHITGVLDMTDGSGLTTNESFTGTYSIGADHRGTMSISSAGGTGSAAFALGGISGGIASFGRLINTDADNWNSGFLKKQDTSAFSNAALNGSFAFGGSGMDSSGAAGWAGAGRFTMNGSGGISSGSVDFYDLSGPSGAQSFTGSYSVATNGRGTVTLTIGVDTIHFVFYVVSANEAFAVAADPVSGGGALWSAQILKQSGTFNAGSLNADAVVAGQWLSTSGGGATEIGVVTGNGAGSITVVLRDNHAGTISGPSTQIIPYTVASNGRVSLGTGAPVFYLVSANKAFGVGTEEPESVWFEPRAAGPFSNAYLSGNFIFGTLPPTMATASVESGAVTINGTGGISGTYDDNDQGTVTSGSITEPYTVNGDGTVTFGSGENIGYIVSGSKMFMMRIVAGNDHPTITVVEK